MRNVAQLKDGVAGLLQATNINNTTNLNGALERAARVLAQKADVPEASGRQNYVVYDGVFDYLAPTTIFGGALVDFRPQGVSRAPTDYVQKVPIAQFDRTKAVLANDLELTFEWNQGVGIARVAGSRATQRAILDTMSDDEGWVVGGSASSLAVDETVYYESPASLRFLLTGASSGYLEKTLDNPIDLTDYEDVGVVFLAIDTPSATDLSSLEVRIGSSSTNYNAVSATSGFLGAWPAGKFVLVAFDLSAASQVGTPDFSALDYIRITMTHGATITNMRLGGIFISLPTPYEMIFQSSAIFQKDSDDTLSNTIESDNDLVILNEAAYTLFEYECASVIAFQNGGSYASAVVASINQVLNGIRAPRTGALIQAGLYDLYKADNPSQELRTIGNYIDD